MPRNRSEKNPEPTLSVKMEPLRSIIRANAQGCLDGGLDIEAVRTGCLDWISHRGNVEFRTMSNDLQRSWAGMDSSERRDLVVKYMEHLYATQSK